MMVLIQITIVLMWQTVKKAIVTIVSSYSKYATNIFIRIVDREKII